MFKKSSITFIYILLWYLSTLQGLYIQSSAISMLFYIPFLSISLFYVYETLVKYSNNQFIKCLSAFYGVLVLYGVIHVLFGSDNYIGFRLRSNKEFLIGILNSLTPIFAFYVFSIKGYLKENTFIKWIIPFVILTTLEYYKANELLMQKFINYSFEEHTNNVGYIFLSLAPFVFFLYKKTLFQYILLGYILFFTISSMKRGAIIIGVVFLLWFLLQTLRTASKKKRISVFSITFMLLIAGYHFIENLLLTNEYFEYRVLQTIEGNSSGRDNLYSSIFNAYLDDAGFLNLLFGFGADGTIGIAGNLAHSDWLELLCNCGLLGLFLYIIYWLSFYNLFTRLRNDLLYSLMGGCLLITFVKSIFSMSYGSMSIYICMIIGFCVGQHYFVAKERKIIKS